uniref:S1 motif domain-containing protein n=1 Tax=Zea mays TaxID=4577 RepID=A0A804Q4T2_MAIZE
MPPPSLVSILPAASISPRRRQAKHPKTPTASHPFFSRRLVSQPPRHASISPSAAGGSGSDELHLLEKPLPAVAEDNEAEEELESAPVSSTEEALAPFLKFFQIKQLNVPIKIKIYEWNASGLLSRIEGLRAFLPKPEMMTRPRNFTDLKNKVDQEMHVCITRIDEETNELIISEKEAWAVTCLREGTLLQGTVRKLFPYGAQIRIGETNRGGLLHISNMTHGKLRSVADVLKVGETVKALVIKSTPDRIALSTKDLESEPGLLITNKEKVFSEAEEMARRYREQIAEPQPPGSIAAEDSCDDAVPFNDESRSYANWKWLKFSKSDDVANPKSGVES